MEIRPREPGDVAALVELAFEVRQVDRYPMYLPQRMDEFLISPEAHEGWVARRDGRIIGHAALHPRSAPEIMKVAREATGLADEDLAVVARLLVSPRARRAGVGSALLQTAWQEATSRDMRAVLDVVVSHRAAIEMYRRAGWDEVGTVDWKLPDGSPLTELVFVSPNSM